MGVDMVVVIISLDEHSVIWIIGCFIILYSYSSYLILLILLTFLLQNYFRCLQMVECSS